VAKREFSAPVSRLRTDYGTFARHPQLLFDLLNSPTVTPEGNGQGYAVKVTLRFVNVFAACKRKFKSLRDHSVH
jgi:hypothetical protein